jgi:hypothetical protein
MRNKELHRDLSSNGYKHEDEMLRGLTQCGLVAIWCLSSTQRKVRDCLSERLLTIRQVTLPYIPDDRTLQAYGAIQSAL